MADIAFTLANAPDWQGCQWSLNGDAYAGLTWAKGNPKPKPTEAEIEAAYAALAAARKAGTDRAAAFEADAERADLLDRLRTATPQQIGTWVDNNVTNISEARRVLKAMLKVMAQLAR